MMTSHILFVMYYFWIYQIKFLIEKHLELKKSNWKLDLFFKLRLTVHKSFLYIGILSADKFSSIW